jgi:hypothetical protein
MNSVTVVLRKLCKFLLAPLDGVRFTQNSTNDPVTYPMHKHRDRRSGEEWEPLSDYATSRLGIDWAWRWAFVRGRPMSRDEYESHRSSLNFGYRGQPSYEEYLRLYDMYSETCRRRASGMSEGEAVGDFPPETGG